MSAQYREPALSLNEQVFLRHSLAAGLRLDGRASTDYRSVSLSFPGASGTAQACVGQTRVLAVTTADLIVPFPDRPNEGALNLFVNFSPMASPAYEAGHPSDRGVETARIVERGLRESRAIDLESLCVLAGEKVWAVRVDAHVLDAGGNVLDALNLAVVTALLHFRRPDVTVIGDSVTVHSVEDRQPVALALHHIPVSCSFAFFDPAVSAAATPAAAAAHAAAIAAGQAPPPLMVVDPSLKEELCADSGLTVTLNVHGELCCLQKSGGTGVDLPTLLQATQVAAAKTTDLTALIQTRLKEDAALANTGNAVRGGGGKAPVFRAPVKPIDAFGSNVVKPAGEHVVAGKPIEISMGAEGGAAADGKGEDSSDEDEDDESASEADDANMADEEEFAQVAQKLQNKAAAAATTAAPAAKGKKK